jgi:tRNA threonylcarbamoyladenosine biosynthesis protein TsaB
MNVEEIGPAQPWGWWEDTPAADAVILALDTSSRVGGVALTRGQDILGEETWLAGGSQTAQVLPAAERLWTRAGLAPADLHAVVVATGPGSFTGLRVGVSLGKGLALSLEIPLYGVPTLDVVAHQHRYVNALLCAVVDAGRGQRYVGWYRQAQGRLRRTAEPQVLNGEELARAAAASRRPVFVCGELAPDDLRRLRDAAGSGLRAATAAGGLRRPACLAELGRWRLARQAPTDAAALQPLYLKRAGA